MEREEFDLLGGDETEKEIEKLNSGSGRDF